MGSLLTGSTRWEQNEILINKSCDALGYSGVPNPTADEQDGILEAIAAESKESGLDQRFILAIMVSRRDSRATPADLRLTRLTDARVEGLCASKVHIVTR